MNALLSVAEKLADPANETINHIIDRTGVGSVVVGGSIKIAEKTGVIEQGLTLTDLAAVVAIIGGLLYIVKLTMEIIITGRKLGD